MRVSQCAEISRMADGFGNRAPSCRHAIPVSPGCSDSVGAPCETNRTGIVMRCMLVHGQCEPRVAIRLLFLPRAGESWIGGNGHGEFHYQVWHLCHARSIGSPRRHQELRATRTKNSSTVV